MVKICLKLHLPIKGIIRATIFRQFVGGETIEECSSAISRLAEFGIGTVLDYSVEASDSPQAFEHTFHEIMNSIRYGADHPAIAFGVFKVTGIIPFRILEKVSAQQPLTPAEFHDWNEGKKRVQDISALAAEKKVRVFFDAEESWIQRAIDDLCEDAMRLHNKEKAYIFQTVQLYRTDRFNYLQTLFKDALEKNFYIGVKLVRGAYMEKERARAVELGIPSPIQPTKEQADHAYNAALTFCASNVDKIAFVAGTHNEASSLLLVKLMADLKISPTDDRIFFSQLLGMGDHISFNLADKGYHVAKYVPYGPVQEVMPYLFRRAQENTSVKGQTSRELKLIKKEIERRRDKGSLER